MSKKVKMADSLGRVLLLHAKPYKDCWVYVQQIDDDLFFYSVIFKGQLYPFHLEVTHKMGEKLSDYVVKKSLMIVLAAAHSTVDALTNTGNVGEQLLGKTVIDAGEAAWYSKKKKVRKN